MNSASPGTATVPIREGSFLIFAAATLFLGLAAPAADWPVPSAALRYQVDLTRRPTHPSAGFVAQLPDGGILRNTIPATDVVTDGGKIVPSFLLWQNAETGFSVLFADPGPQAKSVAIYPRTDRLPQYWRPETGLTPSGLLCIQPGRDNLGAAQALAKFGRVDAAVHLERKAGIPKAPLSIGGDDSGRPKPAAFYLLAYLDAPEAGKYWLSPFVREGTGEVLVDGNKLNPKARSKKWGGEGAQYDFTKGLHRVEVFQTVSGTGPYSSNPQNGGLMYLSWAPPKETIKGENETRILKETEVAHSGVATLKTVEARDGAPVAGARAKGGLVYWFEDEEPLIIYELTAAAEGQPADTQYTWNFPEGATVEGKTVRWIFPAFREYRVRLTARSAKGSSQSVLPFFAFSTASTSLDRPEHREAFRAALNGMLEAYPRTPDPVSAWSEAYWNNLLRTVEGGEGYPLLLRLFTDRWETVRKKLNPGQLYALQDVFLDVAQRDQPKEALAWEQRFQTAGADPARQSELRLREAELQMYYLGDTKAATPLLTALAVLPNEFGERARIRLGDAALLGGDLNKATALYAEVQNRARQQRNAAPVAVGALVTNQLVDGGPARPAATPDWRSKPLAVPGGPKPGAAGVGNKLGALQEVSLSENVRTLTEKDFLLEARQALGEWEREFPLSKLSGDFILRESALYMKMEDWKRARPMLEAYCREIDASSFLPDAATMLIACVKAEKAPPASIRDVIEKVLGRLKFHPVARELEQFLAATPKG